MQTFAMADANVCIRGCIYLHPGKQIFKGPKRDEMCMAILYFGQERRIFQTIILQAFRLFSLTI